MCVLSKTSDPQEELERFWGRKVSKLTPQQTEMVVEIFRGLEQRRNYKQG